MTKVQIKTQALALLATHNADTELTEAITALMEQYAESNKGAVKQIIEFSIDGLDYKWCNRHEVYELKSQFGKNPRDCYVAYKQWTDLGKRAADAVKAFDKGMADDVTKGEMKELFQAVKDAKALRAGRYELEAGTLQFNDLEAYDYDATTYIDVPADASITLEK